MDKQSTLPTAAENNGEESMTTPAIEKAHRRYAELRNSGKIPTITQKFRQHPTPLRAIRLMCIECSGLNRKAPKICDIRKCPLWLFRMGRKDPSLLKKQSGK